MAERKRSNFFEVMKGVYENWLAKQANSTPLPIEFGIYNPLAARIGDTLLIPALPFLPDNVRRSGIDVVEVDEYSRKIGYQLFRFTDYLCRWKEEGLTGQVEDRWGTLRVIPDENTSESIYLFLTLDWEDGYQEELHKVELPGGTYRTRDNVYQRIGGLTTPHSARIREVKEGSDATTSTDLEYWDFVRELQENEGLGLEYYFVEMGLEDGYMRGYVGREIPSDGVELVKTREASEAMLDNSRNIR